MNKWFRSLAMDSLPEAAEGESVEQTMERVMAAHKNPLASLLRTYGMQINVIALASIILAVAAIIELFQ